MYIRTKDGTIYGNGGFILEIEKLNLNKIVGNIKYEIIDNKLIKTMYGYEAHIFEYDIIDKSENLAELCDEFVIENIYCGQISHSRYYDYEVAKQNLDIASYDVLYGAIRIAGKGLIFVAKMNEDGVLCLI